MYKLISLIILALSAQAHADFTDNGNGTVTDNIRNLVWEQDTTGEPRNHSMPNESAPSATEYCEKLELAGLTDWRLPRIDELLTLADYNHPVDSPSINPIFSGNIGTTWSSTIYAEDKRNVIPGNQRFWLADLRNGGRTRIEPNDVDITNYYRCVHGDNTRSLKTSENMVIINRNILKDPQHNLYWQRRPDKSILPTNLIKAQNYCTNLEIDEFQDWYLPSISEIQTIIDYTKYAPALDASLIEDQGIIHKAYWSNTPTVDSSWVNWAFNLETGETDQQDTNYLDRNIGALCVRKGEISDNPQPNMIIPLPEEGLSFTAPRVRFFNEDGSIQDYIVDFENVPNDDGELIFKVKAWRTIQ